MQIFIDSFAMLKDYKRKYLYITMGINTFPLSSVECKQIRK